jgi:hypothetical protein
MLLPVIKKPKEIPTDELVKYLKNGQFKNLNNYLKYFYFYDENTFNKISNDLMDADEDAFLKYTSDPEATATIANWCKARFGEKKAKQIVGKTIQKRLGWIK